ncbi:MAG: EAL domain-containing protein [Sulfurimonas sp.]|nr:EAL domain-containing protein [Sulfurimonas sp.]MDD3835395.1 EAL domain-containing protein [Sulfurimonas sp.]
MKNPLILIIDDNFDSRLAVCAALRKKEYVFLEAQGAKEGIGMAIEYSPDLIILDIVMPEIDGYEALRIIKENDKIKYIPILVVSALSTMSEKIVALEYGADGMFVKPFDRVHLAEQVEALVGFRKKNINGKAELIEQKESLDNVLHRQSKELIHFYYTDPLTGLPNRNKLIRDISNVKNLSLILVDIDCFKDIVYFYGHEISDMCLKSFTLKLKELIKGDKYKHYRISGDIFAILVSECSEAEELNSIMKLFENFTYEECEIHFRFTIGASMYNRELLISAEKALKTAKATNENMLIYDEDSQKFKSYEQNIFWTNKIVEAISYNKIIPFYQPILNNKTNKIEKYECLVRIVERDGSIHAPIKFLDISKKSKHYAAITKNVIEKSFKEFENSDYQFSINLSAKDMVDSEMSEYIYSKLNSFGGCNRVIFELLESEGIENYNTVYAFISKVKEYGCQIAIDDFGSGYSNFIHLLRLKVDIIKIDGSLVKDLDRDENTQIIVETIVDFARKLGILTVAEFVHSESISSIVKYLGVDYSQGYFIGEPSSKIVIV